MVYRRRGYGGVREMGWGDVRWGCGCGCGEKAGGCVGGLDVLARYVCMYVGRWMCWCMYVCEFRF
jgi:hypothetical protein